MTLLSVDVPVIETERLILREPRRSDLTAMEGFFASDRACYIGGPLTDWQVFERYIANLGQWLTHGHGWWTLEDRTTGEVAGRGGLGWSPDYPGVELGWQVYDGFEGRGLAFEAMVAARDWWTAQGNVPPVSLIDADNARSRRLAERLGAVDEGEFILRGHSCLIYRHPKVQP